ncbi:hypothetical protein [Burkholderia latens]|uniref:hypothetical protein n=1 Tax=Burkholderia latens TaxID=488446 RepID=UPI00158CDABE|nr:hypothetical protein [Burkholderia latens]
MDREKYAEFEKISVVISSRISAIGVGPGDELERNMSRGQQVTMRAAVANSMSPD